MRHSNLISHMRQHYLFTKPEEKKISINQILPSTSEIEVHKLLIIQMPDKKSKRKFTMPKNGLNKPCFYHLLVRGVIREIPHA